MQRFPAVGRRFLDGDTRTRASSNYSAIPCPQFPALVAPMPVTPTRGIAIIFVATSQCHDAALTVCTQMTGPVHCAQCTAENAGHWRLPHHAHGAHIHATHHICITSVHARHCSAHHRIGIVHRHSIVHSPSTYMMGAHCVHTARVKCEQSAHWDHVGWAVQHTAVHKNA